jgi:putative glutamine amidotransferase
MRPLIGIPQCLDDRGRWKAAREYQYLDTAYASAVDAAGATPVYLPLQRDAEGLIERVDGLLLPGGDDFAPPRAYPPSVRFDPVPERQLDFDRRLLAAALERGLPVLAICYGMQLLALHRGGSLHYDIATDLPAAGAHRLAERDGRHAIAVEPGSRLAAALGDAPAAVNSLHHQAVAEPGGGLRVSAVAEDDLIEAVEASDGSFALGVQWHPEKMDGPHRTRLFEAFAAACR